MYNINFHYVVSLQGGVLLGPSLTLAADHSSLVGLVFRIIELAYDNMALYSPPVLKWRFSFYKLYWLYFIVIGLVFGSLVAVIWALTLR